MGLLGFYFYGMIVGIAEDYEIGEDSDFDEYAEDPEILHCSYTFAALPPLLNNVGDQYDNTKKFMAGAAPQIEHKLKNDPSKLQEFQKKKKEVEEYFTKFDTMKAKWDKKLTVPKLRGAVLARDLANQLYYEALALEQYFECETGFPLDDIRNLHDDLFPRNIAVS